MKILFLLLALLYTVPLLAQKIKPKIDTVQNNVVFTDSKGNQYPVYKSATNRSYIIKTDKNGIEHKQYLFRNKEN